jgi:hypothetical protein
MQMKPNADQIVKFAESWRERLLAKHHGYELSEEQFGMLTTLNTIIFYAKDEHAVSTPTPLPIIPREVL